ncbi:MAG TPA: hypothetical protein VMF64_17105 [Steroidobacteraceae bacterium]|nr:hypothetical protein [Steroidobacteraceae bacterium]
MLKFVIAGIGALLIGTAAILGFASSINTPGSACLTYIVPLNSYVAACPRARRRTEPRPREWLLTAAFQVMSDPSIPGPTGRHDRFPGGIRR